MTYLFVVIALPVINAVLIKDGNLLALALVDTIVAAVLALLERDWGFHYESQQSIRYDRIWPTCASAPGCPSSGWRSAV